MQRAVTFESMRTTGDGRGSYQLACPLLDVYTATAYAVDVAHRDALGNDVDDGRA